MTHQSNQTLQPVNTQTTTTDNQHLLDIDQIRRRVHRSAGQVRSCRWGVPRRPVCADNWRTIAVVVIEESGHGEHFVLGGEQLR